ncbi:MAG: hypothetical protein APR62_03710 [Smithella sp. SDB]|nr:MAG: hypothetical protein APR62_03710 [Smithella sp. SDB]
MKRIGLIFLIILLSQAAFAAENTGFYLGVFGGYVIPQNMSVTDPNNSANYMDAELENGYLVGVTAGWLTPFTQRIMSLEMEYNYIFGTDFDKDKVLPNVMGGGPGKLDGSISIHAILFNVKARYPEGRIHPYAGLGLGWSFFDIGDVTITT